MRQLSPGKAALLWSALVVALLGAGLGFGRWRGAAHPLARLDPHRSILYVPFMGSSNSSAKAADAASLLFRFLQGGPTRLLDAALPIYEKLISQERFGGEYPTLAWLCQHLRRNGLEGAAPEADPDAVRFIERFSPDHYRLLQQWLDQRYWRSHDFSRDEFSHLTALISESGPGRSRWDKPDEVLAALHLRPGLQVAALSDEGGYYSLRLSDKVGAEGHVYALHRSPLATAYLQAVIEREGKSNTTALNLESWALPLEPQALDRVFMDGTYWHVYISARGEERGAFFQGLQEVLRDDGYLFICENEPLVSTGIPFAGVRLARELVIGQVEAYGFRLVEERQFIPQRYLLVFQKGGRG